MSVPKKIIGWSRTTETDEEVAEIVAGIFGGRSVAADAPAPKTSRKTGKN